MFQTGEESSASLKVLSLTDAHTCWIEVVPMRPDDVLVAVAVLMMMMVMDPAVQPIMTALWSRAFGTHAVSLIWLGQYPLPRILKSLQVVDRRGRISLIEPTIEVHSPIAGRLRIAVRVLVYHCVVDPHLFLEVDEAELDDRLTSTLARHLERQFRVVNRRTGGFTFSFDASSEVCDGLLADLNGNTYVVGVHVALVRVVGCWFRDARQEPYRYLFYHHTPLRGDHVPPMTAFDGAARDIVERGRGLRPWQRHFEDALVEEMTTVRSAIDGMLNVVRIRSA